MGFSEADKKSKSGLNLKDHFSLLQCFDFDLR